LSSNVNEGEADPQQNINDNPLQVNEQNAALAQLGAEIVEATNENKSILPLANFQGEVLPPFNTLLNMAGAQSAAPLQNFAPPSCTF
jgi:hypothetical protein